MDPKELTAALHTCVKSADLDADTPFVAGIHSQGAEAWHEAPGNANADPPVVASSLHYAASLSKQIVGACVALAIGEEQIGLDDSLAHWFPDLPGWAADVRLNHLLHHTGGLPDESDLLQRMTAEGATARTSDGMLSALHSFETLAESPGSSFRYSNIGYVCLARIVELGSGESFQVFSQRRIFDPLGMTSSLFWDGPNTIPLGAVPVDDDPGIGQPFSLGDGGLWTTVSDFLRWNVAMNRDSLGVSQVVQQTGTLNDGSSLDYAWGIRRIEQNGYTGWSHGGGWPGIFTKSVRFPELQAGFVAFTLDSDIDPILRLTDQVCELLTSCNSGNPSVR